MNGVNGYQNFYPYNMQSYGSTAQRPIYSNSYSYEVVKQPTGKKKVGFVEGAKLIAKGFVGQAKDMVTSIFEHPIRTAATVLGTGAALMALPIVGIPTAVSAAALAIGFGALGAGKILYNTAKAIKQNNNGEYEKAQDSFKNIGAAGVDLALSLPFVPKAIKSIKEFAQYGKISVNSTLVNNIKNAKGMKQKIVLLTDANQELARNYNYQAVVDEQLAKLSVTDAEKAAIKQELLDFNVPENQIIDVALEKLKQRHGFNFDITLRKQAMQENYLGHFDQNRGEIVLKDFSKPDLPPTSRVSTGVEIKEIKNFDTDNYMCTIVDKVTGKHNYKLIPKRIWNERSNLIRECKKLSKNGQNLTTLVHEFEHLVQFGDITAQYGFVQPASQNAKILGQNIARARGPLSPSQAAAAAKYKDATLNYSSYSKDPIGYIKNELEIGARKKELAALKSQEFQRLENVFKNLKEVKPYDATKDINIATAQVNNAVS